MSGLRSTINTYHVTFFQHNENKSVTVWHNLPDIVRFGPYRPHGFVLGDHAWPQNAYDKLTTSTTNKARNQLLTRRYGILQSTPLMEPDDPVGTTRQPMRSALIPNVTARPNLPYIVRFGPYRHHDFVPSDTSLLLSLAPKNMYDKLATSTTNKASNQLFTHRCGILQSTPLKEPDDSVSTTRQPVRLAPIPNVIARHNLLDIICFGPYCPHGFILGDHAWSQNTSDKLATSTTNKARYYILTHRCEIL